MGAIVAGIAFCAGVSSNAAGAATTFTSGAPVISITNEQLDGTIWILAGSGTHRTISKVNVVTGSVIHAEAVSPQATSIAQAQTGGLVLGTANGSASAVVLYDGNTGGYIASVHMKSPVRNVSIAPNGSVTYAVLVSAGHRTLATFDISRRGFPFVLTSTAVAGVPVSAQKAAWVVQADGGAYEMNLFPRRITTLIAAAVSPGRAITVSGDGSTIYILAGPPTHEQVRIYSLSGTFEHAINVPSNSISIAASLDGSTLFDGVVAGHSSGYVVQIPL